MSLPQLLLIIFAIILFVVLVVIRMYNVRIRNTPEPRFWHRVYIHGDTIVTYETYDFPLNVEHKLDVLLKANPLANLKNYETHLNAVIVNVERKEKSKEDEPKLWT